MTIVEFLRGRLDEDEAAARKAKPGPWHDDGGVYATHPTDEVVDYAGESAQHIARHDPARVLAEVDAKRRIVDHEVERMRSDWRPRVDEHRLSFDEWQHRPTAVLRLLALPYADHPDYDPAWRP